MKKAKIMLTTITVLAVIGGALAFNAKTFCDICGTAYVCDTSEQKYICVDAGLGENSQITFLGEGEIVLTNATVTNVNPQNAPCDVACYFTLDLDICD